MTRIKICGLKSMEDINIVNKYLPEYIGFVFAGSKRRIDKITAAALKQELNKSIKAVGVFVDEPTENIVELCNENIIDLIQLHGNEKEEYISYLKKLVTKPIIKAVGVDAESGFLSFEKYRVDYMLYDTAVKGQCGGSGISFRHTILKEQIHPFFLAGGLHEGNVIKAINDCKPYCVDVSSGVETDGKKDESKIKDFINAVRSLY